MNFAQTFKALSNPIRRSILELLKAGKLSAGDIAGHFDVAGATISHHLSLLKQADLIREEKEKNFIYYELNTSVLEDLMVWLVDLKGCLLYTSDACRRSTLCRSRWSPYH